MLPIVAGVLRTVAIIAGAMAVGGALLLSAAGLGHLRHQHILRAVLRAQRLLPRRLCSCLLVAATGSAELLVGASVLAVLLAAPPAAVAPLVMQAAGYGVFTGYLWVLRRRRPGVPCGCFGAGGVVTWLVVVRAGVLAAGAAGAALLSADIAAMPVVGRLLCLAGGLVVAMVGWLLPVLADGAARPGGQEMTVSLRPGERASR